VRFHDRIEAAVPALGGGGTSQEAPASPVHGVVELGMVAEAQSRAAVAQMGLPDGQAHALAEDVQRKRVRLVQVPLFDAAGSEADTGSGHARLIQVSSGGYSRTVALSTKPVVVTLPINGVGTIAFRTLGGSAQIGMITLPGPVPLPTLPAGQELDVGVVAQ